MEKAFHVHFFSTCVLPEPASSCSQLEHWCCSVVVCCCY
jgi:hypothetical protein